MPSWRRPIATTFLRHRHRHRHYHHHHLQRFLTSAQIQTITVAPSPSLPPHNHHYTSYIATIKTVTTCDPSTFRPLSPPHLHSEPRESPKTPPQWCTAEQKVHTQRHIRTKTAHTTDARVWMSNWRIFHFGPPCGVDFLLWSHLKQWCSPSLFTGMLQQALNC